LSRIKEKISKARNIDIAIAIFINEARDDAYNNGLRDSMTNSVALKLAEQSYLPKFEEAINSIKR